MTLDEQTDDSGALTRRERRRRTGAVPVVADPDAGTPEDFPTPDADAPVTEDVVEEDASPAPETGDADDADDAIDATDAAPAQIDAATPADVEDADVTAVDDAPDVSPEAPSAEPVSGAGDTEPAGDEHHVDGFSSDALADSDAPTAVWADENSPPTALLWVDPTEVEAATQVATIDTSPVRDDEPDLLVGSPRRGFTRPGILIPIGTLVALAVAYSATALMWPLHELPPTIEAVTVEPTGAEAAAFTWPSVGSAGVTVEGIGTAASTGDAAPIASITKVVSVMLVLDAMPLKPGEQGPSYSFDNGDSSEFWSYLRDNQSALDVPVGGSLTEYQMLQGILLGSANNYIDRLADEIWGSDGEFADAAEAWLTARGLGDIKIVTPSGRNENNTASPQSLTALASIAMANPVFAEIVGTSSVDLPGAGHVKNSNGLLAESGYVGVKTGSLGGDYNLLSGKDVVVGDTTVRIYAAVLGQEGNDERLDASRALYTQVEAALHAQGPAVAAGTVVGQVSTPWGAGSDIVTDADASVVLWNSAVPTADVAFDLGETTDADAAVGTITIAGPVNTVEVPVVLAEDIEGPTAWWRLTHPLELFGVTD